VRWKGYDESHDEWKKESDITKAALDEYRAHLEQAALTLHSLRVDKEQTTTIPNRKDVSTEKSGSAR
jgi:hypothetical protein